MRVGIDARTILNPEKSEGIGEGHYTYQLLRHILEVDSENEYTLFFDSRARANDIRKFDKPNVRVRFYPFSDYKRYLPVAYSEILGRATLMREHLDILHSTSPSSRIPLGYTRKCVTTFHNMGMMEQSECYPYAKRAREVTIARYMAKKSNRIIASSQSVSQSIQKEFHVTGKNIQVVYGGVDGRFFEASPISDQKVREKFSITHPYILFLGTLSPINNIVRLLESFAKFRIRYTEQHNTECPYILVLAGKRGWLSREYQQTVRDLGLSQYIVFTGYVVGDALVPLFRGAEFFVLPSLYEGFGTTVLEAFACDVPAIVSRAGSMTEVAGDAARYVNPMDSDEIATAMLEFSGNSEMRAEYAKKGREQVKKFNWEKTAKETISVYEQVVGERAISKR